MKIRAARYLAIGIGVAVFLAVRSHGPWWAVIAIGLITTEFASQLLGVSFCYDFMDV